MRATLATIVLIATVCSTNVEASVVPKILKWGFKGGAISGAIIGGVTIWKGSIADLKNMVLYQEQNFYGYISDGSAVWMSSGNYKIEKIEYYGSSDKVYAVIIIDPKQQKYVHVYEPR